VGVIVVAAILGIDAGTVYRYVSRFVVVGLLERDPEQRKYRVVRVG